MEIMIILGLKLLSLDILSYPMPNKWRITLLLSTPNRELLKTNFKPLITNSKAEEKAKTVVSQREPIVITIYYIMRIELFFFIFLRAYILYILWLYTEIQLPGLLKL